MTSNIDLIVSPVDQARMGGGDPNSRLTALETIVAMLQTRQSSFQTMAENAADTGVIGTAALWLGTGDPNDPVNSNATGVFICSPGITISGTTYNILTFLNGVLEFGVTSTGGNLQTGNGAGVINAQGIHIYNGATEVGRFGDLNGFLSYIVQTFGIAIGSSIAYLTYDPVNGLRIKGNVVISGVFPHLWDAWDEDVDMVPDGVSTIYSTENIYASGTLQVILNGIFLRNNGDDYTEGSANTIYMTFAPRTGDVLSCNYIRSDTYAAVYNEVPTGSINGTNTQFTTAHNHVAGSVELYLNGVALSFGDDYRNAMRTFIFTVAPSEADVIEVAYLISTNSKFILQEVPTPPAIPAVTTYTLAHNYVPGTPIVTINGVKQTLGNDYTESAANQITFVTSGPQAIDFFRVTYQSQ